MDKIKVLIFGANSDVGTSVERWLKKTSNTFQIDTLDSKDSEWKNYDFSQYDVVFHVAGIAHVNAKKSMKPLYYKVNRDLAIEAASLAKKQGVKQYIYMSSMIVFQESRRLGTTIITNSTKPNPNGFYGDSKLQAEVGLLKLNDSSFKVVILRPPMIYGKDFKGNFTKLIRLSQITPIFPEYHNKRSMLFVNNLAEFIKQAILHNIEGIYYPQNRELADTVEIVRWFSRASKHKVFFSRMFNGLVTIFAPLVRQLPKMFATYYYDPTLSQMNFEYQVFSQEESFKAMFAEEQEGVNNEYMDY